MNKTTHNQIVIKDCFFDDEIHVLVKNAES